MLSRDQGQLRNYGPICGTFFRLDRRVCGANSLNGMGRCIMRDFWGQAGRRRPLHKIERCRFKLNSAYPLLFSGMLATSIR